MGAENTNLPEKELPALIGTIEDVPSGTIKNALVSLDVTDIELAKVRGTVLEAVQKYDGSKASYEAVKRARLDVVPKRTSVKKKAEEGRAEAIAVQKLWIGAEKTVTKFYADLEALCAAKEEEYETARKKEADELAAKEKARVDDLLAQLAAYEWQGNPFEVAQDSPVQFAERLSKSQESFRLIEAGRKAEAERKAKEEQEARELAEANRKEAERLAQIKAEQDAAAAKLQKDREDFERQQREARETEEARQRKIKEEADKAERERLAKIAEDERKAREAAEAEAAQLKAEAEERLRAENEARIAKIKEEAEAKAAEEERARLAALAPDKEKLEAVARGFESTWAKLDLGLTTEEAQGAFVAAEAVLIEVVRILRSVK